MERKENLKLVRIFIGESDKYKHKPLYEEIVYLAKKTGMAGATVTRGIMGFGAHSVVHKAKMIELSNDLPVIIEVVDADEKIRKLITSVEELFEESGSGGLITIEDAEVILYKPGEKRER